MSHKSNLSYRYDTNKKRVMNKTKNKNRDAQKNAPVVIKSVESVLRPEGNLWSERFVKKVGLEI